MPSVDVYPMMKTDIERFHVVCVGETMWMTCPLGAECELTVFLSPAIAIRLATQLKDIAPKVQKVIDARCQQKLANACRTPRRRHRLKAAATNGSMA